ncbi:MAG TPA: ATP-dependent DNA helicase RecG [Rhodospirillaceae bacterium]|jgi:ATP-dependent DNA helicase RecG|nr:ATP-dependent DNA helicase RecG [Alphaproteobacteria bacterium]HBH26509.1 ATP-dependent DNA helicase RecG [Rhodospirillaceae bacterium]
MAPRRERPFVLDPLFAPATALPGVGPRVGKLLEKACGGPKVADVLFHLPTGVVDRRYAPAVKDALAGQVATLRLAVHKHFPPDKPGRPWRVWCGDETGTLNLVFFHARAEWVRRELPEGGRIVVSGRVEMFDGRLQMVHPDAIGPPEAFASIAVLEPSYALTAGLAPGVIRRTAAAALGRAPDLPEWADASLTQQKRWPAWRAALHTAHYADPLHDEEAVARARERLAYDEFLAQQMTLALLRARERRNVGRAIPPAAKQEDAVRRAAGFTLTNAQERAWAEIGADMASGKRMLRLLQGDVGSGKTIVAALAAARAVGAGAQSAVMAPTEILARQHARTLAPLMAAAGITTVALTGRDKAAARREALAAIAAGAAGLIIGTHAIFQEEVAYKDLALAIVDEQHKFGVDQRLALAAKGRAPDLLLMSATPIPRSLALVSYGDLDVSRLDEKPPGRHPVDTRLVAAERMESLVQGLARRIADGARVYWVCPLVEESMLVDYAAAQERFKDLRERLGPRVGLVHGRMDGAEREAVMADFAAGALDILVATTVIEVGVDVPEASVMVVERAERFGLAQLHQLRGRVGRGAAQSYCILLYGEPVTATARKRLEVLRRSEDGFLIAEEDLRLRGAGDILGLRQSGEPAFRFGDPVVQADLLAAAQDDARAALARDPDLVSPRGQTIRALLYLMERDKALRYLKAG